MPLEIDSNNTPAESFGWRMTLTQIGSPARISSKDRMFFTEQLALLLETGTSLHASLQALSQQTDNAALKTVIESLALDISEGKTFSSALYLHSDVFSETYINLIAASENGGFMFKVLNEIRDMEEQRERLRNVLVSAVSYPLFLAIFSLSVVLFVLLVVFPKFADMFAAIADDLPASTMVLMWASAMLQAYWLPLLTTLAVLAYVTRRSLTSTAGARRLDRFKLGFPLIRDIFVQLYLIQSLRVLSLSIANGVSVMDALNACGHVVRNRIYREFITSIKDSVRDGGSVANAFDEAPFIPGVTKQMIATGEETGNLAMVMARIADFYEQSLSKRLSALSKMAEPTMLLVMGLVVGVLVSSLILPIFKLSKAVY